MMITRDCSETTWKTSMITSLRAIQNTQCEAHFYFIFLIYILSNFILESLQVVLFLFLSHLLKCPLQFNLVCGSDLTRAYFYNVIEERGFLVLRSLAFVVSFGYLQEYC